jgi:hypothetical protein
MSSLLIKSMAIAGIGAYVETKYGETLFAAAAPGTLSPLFVLTPTILLGVGFYALVHGMEVGRARQHYMELAKKDGEKDAEERYSLPNLYVHSTGNNSKHARAFNAVQRSHQHILETYPLACVGALLGAWQFPLASALATLAYASGRIIMSSNYAASEGNASLRYANPLAIWLILCNSAS